jgi:hypothetical protein
MSHLRTQTKVEFLFSIKVQKYPSGFSIYIYCTPMFLPLRGRAKFFFGLSRAPPGVRGKVLCRSGGKIYYCSLYNLLGIILDLARRRIDENVLSPVALLRLLGSTLFCRPRKRFNLSRSEMNYIYSYASRRCSLCLGSKFRIHALNALLMREPLKHARPVWLH